METWEEYYEKKRFETPLFKGDVAAGLNVSVPTVQNYNKKAPANRRQVIMLAAMHGMDVDETNEMLNQAGFSRLYSLNGEDATWLFLLRQSDRAELNKKPHAVFERYYAAFERERALFKEGKISARNNRGMNTTIAYQEIGRGIESDDYYARVHGTKRMVEGVEESYLRLIDDLFFGFENRANRKLIQAIQLMFFDCSTNSLLADYPRFKGRFYDAKAALERQQKIPSRDILLGLAIHLSLDGEDTNRLLEAARLPLLDPNSRAEKLLLACMKKVEELDQSFTDYKTLRDYISENRGRLLREGGSQWTKLLKCLE